MIGIRYRLVSNIRFHIIHSTRCGSLSPHPVLNVYHSKCKIVKYKQFIAGPDGLVVSVFPPLSKGRGFDSVP